MIKFQNVSKVFKTDLFTQPFTALEDVSFQIKQGELIGFLGANGAGKTTSLKILLNFIPPSEGSVLFSEKLGQSQQEILGNIGFVPERPYFYPHLTGRSFLTFMGKLNKLEGRELDKKIDYWTKRLSIEPFLNRQVRRYSKGMLQRLGFVSSLLHDPQILILDEPLSGLDPVGRKEFKDIMVELNKLGKTIFFSSHIVSDVEEISTGLVILEKGKKIFEGSTREILDRNITQSFTVETTKELSVSEFKSLELKNKTDWGFVYSCDTEEKNIIVDSIVRQNIELISLTQNRLSLEDIVYKLRD